MNLATLQSALKSDTAEKVKNSMTGPLIFLSIVSLFNTCKLNGIEADTNKAIKAYTKAPVLAQLTPDGKAVTVKQITEGYLNELNVSMFVQEVLIPLYRYDRNLPAELGGGPDPGVTVPEIQAKVSTLHWIMSQSFVAPEQRATWLKSHAEGAPQQDGYTSFLMAPTVKLAPYVEGAETRVATVIATKIVADKNGAVVQRGPWERDVELRANLLVKPLIKPTKLELALSYATRRGLAIVSVRPVKNQEIKK